MFFLKKSSIADILKYPISEDIFYSGINILEHYKEYEIFLTKTSLEEFFSKGEIIENRIKSLRDKLNKHKASIKAIHCPASLFPTSNDKTIGSSTNYLSLDEVYRHEESWELLKKTILLAEEFSAKDTPVVVVLHAGSINGCSETENILSPLDDTELEQFAKKLNNLKNKNPVKIALENVTPYVDISEKISSGGNKGWGESYLEYIDTLKSLNEKLDKKQSDEKSGVKISFGVCIDFCHLIADFKIMKDKCLGAETCCEYIKSFMQKLSDKQADIIMLFHVSMLGEDGSHGRLFRYNNDDDKALLETIKSECAKYPDVPITIEMADGTDVDKACLNFDRIMYTFSAMHKSGVFGRMLEKCPELKEYFENLFQLYTVPWSNMNRIQNLIFKIKQYTMKNSPQNEKNDSNAIGGLASVFGFTYDENKENTALLRLKAYIVYTRFCNLGKYLAEIYEEAKFLSDRENDFILSMKYFMFCDDEIKQCVYTGVGYTFNMDFLPKKIKNVYRFYNENTIKHFETNKKSDKTDKKSDHHCFSQMAECICQHISGISLNLFSCGKNFFPCLMKYYHKPEDGYSKLRIYKDMAVNYVEVDNKTLSVPAFLQKYCYINKQFPEELDFVIDVSVFRNGRGFSKSPPDLGTLAGFIENLTANEIVYEKAGSVVDGEIVSTKLPDTYVQYTLDINAALGLVQACKEFRNKDIPISRIEITDKNGESSIVRNKSTIQDIENIIKCVEVSENETAKNYTSYYKEAENNLPELYEANEVKIERGV